MTIKILMPALSPTMTEGDLTKWLISEGDSVKAGDVIAEIETDKATMEVEAVDEGVVEKLLFKEGDKSISVNSPIALLSDSDSKSETIDPDNSKSIFEIYASKILGNARRELFDYSEKKGLCAKCNHYEDNIKQDAKFFFDTRDKIKREKILKNIT